jgi:hypothetical protein
MKKIIFIILYISLIIYALKLFIDLLHDPIFSSKMMENNKEISKKWYNIKIYNITLTDSIPIKDTTIFWGPDIATKQIKIQGYNTTLIFRTKNVKIIRISKGWKSK